MTSALAVFRFEIFFLYNTGLNVVTDKILYYAEPCVKDSRVSAKRDSKTRPKMTSPIADAFAKTATKMLTTNASSSAKRDSFVPRKTLASRYHLKQRTFFSRGF